MRVLVTGGLGFVGHAVVRDLLAAGHAFTALTQGQRPGARPAPGADLVRADLRDRDAVHRVVADGDFDGVCHLAALTRVRDSLDDPIRYFAVNVTGTLNLLEALDAAASHSGRPVRLVFASTCAMYGPGQIGLLDEDVEPHPTNPYGASKLVVEELLRYQAATGRLAAISLRCFNIAGAVAGVGDTDLTRLIPKALAVVTGAVPSMRVNGDGSAVREFTHVADVAVAYRLALQAAEPGRHRVHHVGSGQGVSVSEVIDTVERVAGRPVRLEHMPAKSEAHTLVADSSRIRSELGWTPARSALDDIVRDGLDALGGRPTEAAGQ